MSNLWTPTSPLTIGQPWMVTTNSPVTVRNGVNAPVQRLRSLAAETVDGIQLGIFQPDGGSAPFIGVAEVFAAGNELPSGTVQEVAYQPNSDASLGSWHGPGGVGDLTDLWDEINDPVVPGSGTGTYMQMEATSPSAYRYTANTAAFPLTRRVANLTVRSVFAAEDAGAITARQFTVRLHHVTFGAFTPAGASFWANIFGTPVHQVSLGELNPVTMLPWTPQDIRDFDVGGDWQVRIESVASASTPSRIYASELLVTYFTTENRVAAGSFERVAGFNSLSMIETGAFATYPAGASTWSKPNAYTYSVLVRQAADGLVNPGVTLADDMSWWTQGSSLGQFGGDVYPPVPYMAFATVPMANNSRYPASAPSFNQKKAATINVMLAAGGVSDDSQPYCQTLRSFGICHSTSTITQRITAPATDDYGGYRFLAAPPLTADAPLTVEVYGVVSGLQVGPTLTVDADDARARLIDGIVARVAYIAGFFDTPIPLVAGTQYEVRFTTSATSGDVWTIFGNGDGTFNPDGDSATMGGATDKAGIPGLSSAILDGIDISFALSVAPDPPTYARADVVTVELGNDDGGPGRCEHCAIPYVEMVDVSWDTTAIGDDFDVYVVQRTEIDSGGVWETVTTLDDESVDSFRDPTTRRSKEGVATRYRVRAQASDGSFTTWAETDWVATRTKGVEVVIASLTDPDATLAFNWDPEVTYTYLSAERDTIIPLYGADRQVAFSEVENRGKAFPMRLIANFWDAPPAGGGSAVFDPLEDLCRLPGPYTAVMNHHGERFYAHVQLVTGVNTEPHNRYIADIQVTEVAVNAFPLAVT